MSMNKKCVLCGSNFEAIGNNAKYCLDCKNNGKVREIHDNLRISNAICKQCKISFYKSPSNKNISECCSIKCSSIYQLRKYIIKKEIEFSVNIEECFKKLYLVDKWTFRKLSKEYSINGRTIKKILKYYDIPIRHGSEAIKTQWINNDKRREWSSENLKKQSKTTTIHKLNEVELQKRMYGKDGTIIKIEKTKNKTYIHYKCNICDYIRRISYSKLKGCACPICNESSGERKIRIFLQDNNLSFMREYKIKKCKLKRCLPFDFAVFNKNKLIFLIEFDGAQHYEPKHFYGGDEEFCKIKERDNTKDNYCKNQGINLIRIPYHKYDDIEHILNNELEKIDNIQLALI